MKKVSDEKIRLAFENIIDILIEDESVEFVIEQLLDSGWTRDDLLAECFDIEDIDEAIDRFNKKK